MADKGFDIDDDLKKIDLKLNIAPFLEDQAGFNEGDVLYYTTFLVTKNKISKIRMISGWI